MRGKPDRSVLQTTALLISNEEAVEAIRVREEEQAARKAKKKCPVVISDQDGEEGEGGNKRARKQGGSRRKTSSMLPLRTKAERVAGSQGEARRREIIEDSESESYASDSDSDTSVASVIQVARTR